MDMTIKRRTINDRINRRSIVRETNEPETFTYYRAHPTEVADHSLVPTQSPPAQSAIDSVNRFGFDNWAEPAAEMFPDDLSARHPMRADAPSRLVQPARPMPARAAARRR